MKIGIGAILGAPFMLSTLAIFVCGISICIFTLTKKRTLKVRYNQTIMRRDLGYFLVAYAIAVACGLFDIGFFRYIVAGLLIIGYAIYVRQTIRSEGDLEGECRALLPSQGGIPQMGRVVLQLIVALAAIILGLISSWRS